MTSWKVAQEVTAFSCGLEGTGGDLLTSGAGEGLVRWRKPSLQRPRGRGPSREQSSWRVVNETSMCDEIGADWGRVAFRVTGREGAVAGFSRSEVPRPHRVLAPGTRVFPRVLILRPLPPTHTRSSEQVSVSDPRDCSSSRAQAAARSSACAPRCLPGLDALQGRVACTVSVPGEEEAWSYQQAALFSEPGKEIRKCISGSCPHSAVLRVFATCRGRWMSSSPAGITVRLSF